MDNSKLLERTRNWWYCDNIVTNKGEIGLLHMGFPRLFILIRDEKDAYFSSYEEFALNVAEVNFFDSCDREEADMEQLLTDAWNFMLLQEQEEERICEEIDNDID